MRFWIKWWAGVNGDFRPVKDDENLPAWEAHSGERLEEPSYALVGVVDAESQDAAWERVLEYWPEAELETCEEKPSDWIPSDDYGVILERMNRENSNAA